jgi:hypothetical protein
MAQCGVLHIHHRATELHQADTRQFASGTATLASFLSARSKTRATLSHRLCGRRTAANSTLPPRNLHVFLTAPHAHYSIASNTTFRSGLSHFPPHIMYWHAWEIKVSHSCGIQSHINHWASHLARRIGNPFAVCRSLEMGSTWHIAERTTKSHCGWSKTSLLSLHHLLP